MGFLSRVRALSTVFYLFVVFKGSCSKFVKPILKNEALAEYLEVASYSVTNGGIFKHAPESSNVVEKEEAQYFCFVCSERILSYSFLGKSSLISALGFGV